MAKIFLHHRLDAVFCFCRTTQSKKWTQVNEGNVEDVNATKECFEEHQQTICHKSAASYHVVLPQWKDVGETTNENLINIREKKSTYLRNRETWPGTIFNNAFWISWQVHFFSISSSKWATMLSSFVPSSIISYVKLS